MANSGRDRLTEDAVLGGRLKLFQPKRGHRAGHDAILLAAATAAKKGTHVVDLGAGVGAAGLALAARVAGTRVTLMEIDAALAALADENIRLNGFEARVRALALDVAAPSRAFVAAGLAPGSADVVIMNPPFNDPMRSQSSPDRSRKLAHTAPRDTLAGWVKTASRLLTAKGRLTLIWRADGLGDVLAALAPGYGGLCILPVHPKPDAAAIRVIVTAVKGSRAPLAMLPGLTLAEADGRPSAAAEAVLRDGAALPLAGI